MFIPAQYTCHCEWDHTIFSYKDYLRVRYERKACKRGEFKFSHGYRDGEGKLIFIGKDFKQRSRAGYITFPLTELIRFEDRPLPTPR